VNRVFISDCEGPISKNDNAFEVTSHFVPNGDKLFTIVSKYDDVLADVLKKPGYNAGDTLKLILPFLKACGVTDKLMHEFSAQSLLLIANSKDTLEYVRSIAAAFVVSTSYEHYIKALCEALHFPFENTFCTRLSLDLHSISDIEKSKLKKMAKEIAQMPMITIPPSAKSIEDFSKQDQKTLKRLDTIFWIEISRMRISEIFSAVNPVGGHQKTDATKQAVERSRAQPEDVMYVGDSITDVEAFKLVRSNGGLTVSFNGNQYAVRNAEVAVMTENSLITSVIADLFSRLGKPETLRLLENWNREILRNSPLSPRLLDKLFATFPDVLPKVQIVKPENMEMLFNESSEFRKKVRGEAIGKLG
jgi:energy-converting hydrogenase A subunit R